MEVTLPVAHDRVPIPQPCAHPYARVKVRKGKRHRKTARAGITSGDKGKKETEREDAQAREPKHSEKERKKLRATKKQKKTARKKERSGEQNEGH
eukprot:3433431-Rhodomonas_salina.3